MSSGSLKDTVRALGATFTDPHPPSSLPEDLTETLESYLDRHLPVEDGDSQRLQEELVQLYKKNVAGAPNQHGPFLAVLKVLRPAIRGESRLLEWWNLVIKPTVDAIGHKREEIEGARDFLLGVLVFDSDEDSTGENARISKIFSKHLLDAYLSRTKIPTADSDTTSPEDDFIAHELESVLISFGRRKPKELLLAIDELFVQKNFRAQALSLLSAFVRVQPPHLHLVLETPIIQHLQKCLMIDTSMTIVELALTVLIMFMPHVTRSLVSQLPHLFLIYSRILCWDRFQPSEGTGEKNEIQFGEEPDRNGLNETDRDWQKLHRNFDNSQSSTPSLIHYFTFLYGLFPHNFLSFIRKPRKFLKSVNFPGAEDFELEHELIRKRTEAFRRVHLLHPNLFTCTIEDELNEDRWLSSDPADVVTECMGLCVAASNTLDDPGPPPTAKLPEIPSSAGNARLEVNVMDDTMTLVDQSHSPAEEKSPAGWRSAHAQTNPDVPQPLRIGSQNNGIPISRRSPPGSPLLKAKSLDSPTIPAQEPLDSIDAQAGLSQKSSQTFYRNSSNHSSANVAPHKLEAFAQALSQGIQHGGPILTDGITRSIACLQQELMLLRNDLNFERYLKQQHLTHIGQLQRRHLKEATIEAQTQDLINTNKTLKIKLNKANKDLDQLKKETAWRRDSSKKWEGELSQRVRDFKKDEKVYVAETDRLASELERALTEVDKLRRLVVESEARELNHRQNLRALEMDMEEMSALKAETDRLRTQLLELRLSKEETDVVKRECTDLRMSLESARQQIKAREADRERNLANYERKVSELEARLVQAHQSSRQASAQSPGVLSPTMQQMIDSALAASNAKLQHLKKSYTALHEKHVELEMRCQELEAEQAAAFATARADVRPVQNTMPPTSDRFVDDMPLSSPDSRHDSIRDSNTTNYYITKFPNPNAGFDNARPEDEDRFGSLAGPSRSQLGGYSASRPSRFEPPQNIRGFPEEANGRHDFGDSNDVYSRNITPAFQQSSYQEHDFIQRRSSRKNSSSTGSERARKESKQPEKIKPQSEIRVFGRGGAQNIGKKKQDKLKSPDKEKSSKGLRVLKGLT